MLCYLNDRSPRRGENDFRCAQQQPRRYQRNAFKILKENYFQSAILHKSNYQARGKVEQTLLDLQDAKKKFSNSHTSFSQATNKGCAPSGKRAKTRKGTLDTGDPHRRGAMRHPGLGEGRPGKTVLRMCEALCTCEPVTCDQCGQAKPKSLPLTESLRDSQR